MIHLPSLACLSALSSAFFGTAFAGFSTSSSNNVAVYWGQNSYGQENGQPHTQQRLSYYCSNTSIDIIPLAFLTEIADPETVNFANADGNCTIFSGTTLLSCPQMEQDILTCQRTYGKTILLSIGGSTYTQAGFNSSTAAAAAADAIWTTFGPMQTVNGVHRPFGGAVVDGFDLAFEATVSNAASFASKLRGHMDAATAAGEKPFYLSAAPQCPYPDEAENDMLAGAVFFDLIMVQFYNNYCSLQSFLANSSTQSSFDFDTWDTWARTVSKNPSVRILLGIPGGDTAARSGYVSGDTLASVLAYVGQFSSFGGVAIWDMSQVYANAGLLGQVVQNLAPSSLPTANRTTVSGAGLSVSFSTTTVTTATTATITPEANSTRQLRYPPQSGWCSSSASAAGYGCRRGNETCGV